VASTSACAADPIDTDGPDFVESSEVVGKGRAQFEADLVRSGATTSTPTLLRYGIADKLELRLETESVAPERGDLAFGVKWHSRDRDPPAGIPAVSWILHFETPTGEDGSRGHGIRPSLRSVLTWDLPYEFGLGVMPGVRLDATPEGHHFASGIFGATLSKRWTERFRTFVEAAAPQIASSRDGGTVASWDIGAAYLLTNDWQLGVRAATSATRAAPSSQLLFELAGRF